MANGPSTPGRLMNRKWLTVPEAAQYLTLVFGEDVTEADVLRRGLDGQLKLSVRFVNFAQAKRYVEPDYTEEYEEHLQIAAARAAGLPDLVFERRAPTPLEEECARVVVLREEVYDLPLVGGEKLDVKQEYQRQTGGPAVTLTAFDGTFVVSEDGIRFQLYKEDLTTSNTHIKPGELPYYLEANVKPYRSAKNPASYDRLLRLPSDSVLVVRTSALDEFVGQHRKPAHEAQAHPPDATTLPEDSTTDNVPVHSRSSLPATERYPATWEDVSIDFISDHSVQITVKNRICPPQNSSEMGFENRTTKNPNKAWMALRALAEKGGAMSVDIKERETVEKRMQEIRKTLRAHFVKEHIEIPLESDPLPYDKRGKEYRALFQIGTRPSFHA
jgi:hypothetical protein